MSLMHVKGSEHYYILAMPFNGCNTLQFILHSIPESPQEVTIILCQFFVHPIIDTCESTILWCSNSSASRSPLFSIFQVS